LLPFFACLLTYIMIVVYVFYSNITCARMKGGLKVNEIIR
jgi:hypothetical protein